MGRRAEYRYAAISRTLFLNQSVAFIGDKELVHAKNAEDIPSDAHCVGAGGEVFILAFRCGNAEWHWEADQSIGKLNISIPKVVTACIVEMHFEKYVL